MKNHLFLSLSIVGLLFSSCKTIQNVGSAPSNIETLLAVKEVLNSSAFRSLESVAKTSDGGLMALLPDEVQPVMATLRTLGLGGQIDALNKKVEIASEAVLIEGKGLMSDAISEFKAEDAASIILGGENLSLIHI